MFEGRLLRRIFGHKRDEVTGGGKNFIMKSSLTILRVIKSRRMRWAGNVKLMGKGRGVYRVLVRKREGKRPLGKPRCRW
jgi:hypothetical protein